MLTVAPDPVDDAADAETGSCVSPSSTPVSLLDQLVRKGARRMLAAVLEAEVAAYIDAHAGELDEHGRRLVVRNGHHTPREVLTGAGAVEVVVPRVNDKRLDEATGERKRFSSAILPPWCRKSPKVSEVLPLLYLHGLSGNDFTPALEQFLGTPAGLSAATVTRLTAQWQGEAKAFAGRDLRGVDYVYVWADGVHVNICLEEERLCLLVLIGVRTDGRKELIALSEGYRESAGSWADLLRDARRRGILAPVLAVGDGALWFWAALGEVFPQARAQRCWFHRSRKRSTWWFESGCGMIWYGRFGGCVAGAGGAVRGAVAASERAAAAAGSGDRGAGDGPRWGAGGGPCCRGERDDGAPGGGGAGGRPRPVAGRPVSPIRWRASPGRTGLSRAGRRAVGAG
jgi:hypothetical protein